jgi:hypothetical protein
LDPPRGETPEGGGGGEAREVNDAPRQRFSSESFAEPRYA